MCAPQEVHAWAVLPSNRSIVRYYGAWTEPTMLAHGEAGEHIYLQLERCGSNLLEFGKLARSEALQNSPDSDSSGPGSQEDLQPLLSEVVLLQVLRHVSLPPPPPPPPRGGACT